jgi:hypothetical protein
MSKPVRWRNLGSVLRRLLSVARQNWREAYLYPHSRIEVT